MCHDCFLSTIHSPSWEQTSNNYEESKKIYKEEEGVDSALPDNKECIAIQVVTLHSCGIILKYDLHEALIGAIYNGCIDFW